MAVSNNYVNDINIYYTDVNVFIIIIRRRREGPEKRIILYIRILLMLI